ncbi:MAG TPA: methyltransferase domain-containing protein [Ktedonobacteraceae bacterium]|jgi:SAM-dependent methyltransferase|nr:methyltransferase domain-containing protein [Ktedonobacteraceae bacterium]
MQPKPEQFGASFAEAFKDQRVVDAYKYRPPYPNEVFDILSGLITGEPRAVLDVGAGSGDIARQLVDKVERIDAVDFSLQMIEKGKRLPNGNHPHLQWIYGKVEDVPLTPPYALVTAGSSIHWTEWSIAFPRFRSMLTPNGFLALIYRRTLPMPWDADLRKLRAQFSTRRNHRPLNTVEELKTRGFFHQQGEKETDPVPFFQSVDDFIAGLHSRSVFSMEFMGQQQAGEFDHKVRTLLSQFRSDGMLPLQVTATVTWGQPDIGMVE